MKSRRQYKRDLTKRWISEKRCSNCGSKHLVPQRMTCANCLRLSLEGTRRRRLKNPDAFRSQYHERKRAGLCVDCGIRKAVGKIYCPQCSLTERQRAVRLKQEVMDKYGGACACCGEKRIAFLTIDHIQGGGTELRRLKVHAGGGRIYSQLRNRPIDTRLQVLCWNCNLGKRATGVCPHVDDSYYREALNRGRYTRRSRSIREGREAEGDK